MRFIVVLGVLFILGCQDKSGNVQTPIYIDLPELTNSIITNMANRSADVTKKFVLNNSVEDKTILATDSAFWLKELELLAKIDLNAPKYLGALQLSAMNKDSNSNLLFDRLTVTDDNLELQALEIYYLEEKNQVRLINVDFALKNFIAHSNTQLSVWLNEYNDQLLVDSIVVKGRDKVLLQEERFYESHVQRIRR